MTMRDTILQSERYAPLAPLLFVMLAGCGSSDDAAAPPAVTAVPAPISIPYTNGAATPANPVAYWNRIATDTINVPAAAAGTPEERRPVTLIDLATVQVAVYDAVIAITGTHKPFSATPVTNPAGASQEAAVAAATYGVLRALFPSRTAQYQAAYDGVVAGLPADDATTRGLAVGSEVAMRIVALRADDGRFTPVNYAPGTGPGKFRGVNPVTPFAPYIRPFTLTSASQFRVPPPPPLDSTLYATDFNETRSLGGATSTLRTAEQFEAARFHTEPPPTLLTRNFRQFAVDGRSIADNARLMAMLWVAHADANIACFDSKYHYMYWRPTTAIAEADTDGNAATTPDTSWAPSLPTPNHQEYPSAHMCQNVAAVNVLKSFYGTNQISFTFGSTVTASTHAYATPDAMIAEIVLARITGGMHFRNSNVQGGALGDSVARWVTGNYFQPR